MRITAQSSWRGADFQESMHAHNLSTQSWFINTRGVRRGAIAVRCSQQEVKVPLSREEVVQRAGQALSVVLGKGSSGKKSFKKTATSKLAIEISLADTSPESVNLLVSELLEHLAKDLRGTSTLAFFDIQAALLASEKFSNPVISVQDFESRNQGGVLFIVGVPSGREEEALSLTKWRGQAVVLLALDTNSVGSKYTGLRNSFQTLFAFEPFATKGLLRTTEGLLLKEPEGDKAGPWLIFKRAWGDFRLIGRTNARPTASDVEMAFYNSSAAESPVIQGIKAIRKLAGGKSSKE